MQSPPFRASWPGICSLACALVIGVVLLAACSGRDTGTAPDNKLSLTPVTRQPTGIYHPGKFIWQDLLTPDVTAAKQFYGDLFGWTFEENGLYTLILNQGKPVGGIVESTQIRGEDADALWVGSLSIADVDAAAEYVTAQGGTLLKGPMELENRGRGTLISDPLGAHLILLNAAGGDPEDDEPAVGDWLWNEIWTTSPQETFEFYQTLAGFDEPVTGEDYQILVSEGRWRAGIRQVRKEAAGVRWVPTIRVKDPDAITDRVEALGGKVWVRTSEAPSDGNTALISDSSGGLVMVQRWSGQPQAAEK